MNVSPRLRELVRAVVDSEYLIEILKNNPESDAEKKILAERNKKLEQYVRTKKFPRKTVDTLYQTLMAEREHEKQLRAIVDSSPIGASLQELDELIMATLFRRLLIERGKYDQFVRNGEMFFGEEGREVFPELESILLSLGLVKVSIIRMLKKYIPPEEGTSTH